MVRSQRCAVSERSRIGSVAIVVLSTSRRPMPRCLARDNAPPRLRFPPARVSSRLIRRVTLGQELPRNSYEGYLCFLGIDSQYTNMAAG